jgi:hypothetical protein
LTFTPRTAPIFKPDHVEGIVMADDRSKVDRHFYFVDTVFADDWIWEADGYKMTNGKTGETYWNILITCPKCHDILRIDTQRKKIDITKRGVETAEPLRCTNPHHEFGPCMCAFEIEPPKKAMYTRDDFGKLIKIDGFIKRV